MQVRPIKTPIFKEGQDIEAFIARHVKRLKEQSIVVVTSKIVALAEGRTAEPKNARERENIIRSESEWAIRTKYTWLTVKNGIVMASAGVDESNAAGKTILLPKDSFAAAARIRAFLKKRFKVKKVGVIISDSRTLPLRAGIIGQAIGYAGFAGIRDYRGKKDIFGRAFTMSRVDVADGLATAAVLEMGEGNEQRPLAVITDATVEFRERIDQDELKIDIADDMYRPLFEHL